MLLDVTPERLRDSMGSSELSDELERGRILRFGRCPIELPPAEDLDLLRGLGPHLSRKNVSWYFEDDRLVGVGPELRERTRRILSAHSARVRAFFAAAMPGFFRGARPGTTSFRPLQEKGRHLSPHASNELVHVDAGAYGATHGDRILRFFVNVHPEEPRVWASRGTFRELFARHGREAGIDDGRVEPGPFDRAWTGALRLAGRALPALRMIDTSPYDRRMRRFHNYMKDAKAFRDTREGEQRFEFAPFSAWTCLTDAVSHACLSGQHALVDTFIVPLSNGTQREHAPWNVLAGR